MSLCDSKLAPIDSVSMLFCLSTSNIASPWGDQPWPLSQVPIVHFYREGEVPQIRGKKKYE